MDLSRFYHGGQCGLHVGILRFAEIGRLEKRRVGHLALHRSFFFGKRTTQYSRFDPDVIRSLPSRCLVDKPATKHPGSPVRDRIDSSTEG